MKKIKEFFEKKKLSHKFAAVPPGQRLGTAAESAVPQSCSSLSSNPTPPSQQFTPSALATGTASSSSLSSGQVSAKMAAAEAAQRRQIQALEKNKVKLPRGFVPRPAMESEEPEGKKPAAVEEKINEDDLHQFNCPALEINDYYPLAELKNRIMDKIKVNFGEDSVICGSLLIRNCNSRAQSEACIATLESILNNLTTEDEEKLAKFSRLRRIKIENKILSVNGGSEFLTGMGFKPSEDGEWFVLNEIKEMLSEKIPYYLDVLTSSDIFPIKLDRETRIYNLNDLNTPNLEFDDQVFEYSKDELAKEQQIKKELADRELTLMTQAMRERYLNKKPVTRYIRLRYKRLDLTMIEATFRSRETILDLINWLREEQGMEDIEAFDIACGTQVVPVTDWGKTFLELDFYPKVTFYQKAR